jgi:N-acyl-D-aspartate/D-glutamate deacylase
VPRAFHRHLALARVLSCPEHELDGQSFTEIAKRRGVDAIDLFLDLVARHGTAMRWTTMMANDRDDALARIIAHPDVLIGFSDAGAHLRQMAHYSFPLRMLMRVKAAIDRGRPFLTMEAAVQRLTSEIGAWFGVDVGVLAPGRRADLAIVDPEGLTADLEDVHEAPLEGFGNFVRLVRNSDRATRAVVVGGRVAAERGVLRPAVGRERGFGTVIRAR